MVREMNNSDKQTFQSIFFHNIDPSQIGMDCEEFGNSTFQRVYQYLRRHEIDSKLLDQFKYERRVEGDTADCLKHLLK